MRQGTNPNKNKTFDEIGGSNHRIISAIYIPHLNNYYQDSLQIIDLFLSSLTASISNNTKITIIDNASCLEIKNLLNKYFLNGKIDKLITNKKNLGKIDTMISALRGSHESLVTLTDSDILFKSGWQRETIKIFNVFPKVGAVSPMPLRGSSNYYTVSVMEQILKGKLKLKQREIPQNHKDHNLYLKSIGWPPESELKNWNIVSKNNLSAIMGAGHAVITVNRDAIIRFAPKFPSNVLLGRNSENDYIDIPIDRAMLLRLSTYYFWAHHMGNKAEFWMSSKMDLKNCESTDSTATYNIYDKMDTKNFYFSNFIRSEVIYKIRKKIIHFFYEIIVNKLV